MRLRALLFQALVLASGLGTPLHAGELFSCFTLGGLNSCAGATFFLGSDPQHGTVLTVSLTQWTTPLPLRVTAFGLYCKQGPDQFADNFHSPSAWGGPVPASWTKKST